MTEPRHHHIRFRGRSFPVLAIEPESPLPEWIAQLDNHIARAPTFFSNKPIVVDVSGLGLARSGIVSLVKDLSERGVRILGLTGVEPSWACAELPPILVGGRAVKERDRETQESAKVGPRNPAAGQLTAEEQDAFSEIGRALGGSNKKSPSKSATANGKQTASDAPLIVNAPVRSGQSICHPNGDVTVVGSVASGAEVIAGGSVHIYGSLRGRAMAGAFGEAQARIFCRRFEAEFLAIGGVYVTADEIEASVRGHATQAWLENEAVKIARLD